MRSLIYLPLLFSLVLAAAAQEDCSQFDKDDTPYIWRAGGQSPPYPGNGTAGHKTGNHEFSYDLGGSCTYSGSTPGQQCAITCTSTASAPFGSDVGTITPTLYHHDIDINANIGQAQAPGGGVTIQCASTAAAAVRSCPITCAVAISFSGSQSGVGISVSFPPDSIFSNSGPQLTTCGPQQLPVQVAETCCNTPSMCTAGNGYCDTAICECLPQVSPILIDTTGKGFHLTSAANGVTFDFFGNGRPLEISWTDDDSGNGFLALDRNHNGRIDNAKELFGNITEQPPSATPNGYLALAEFDKPKNGGNGDGIIDARDAVYSQLLIWIDANHNGISEPEELHSLPSLGVYSVGLKYVEEPLTDQYGNRFRFRGVLNPDPADGTSKDGRYTYDVFLVRAPDPNAKPCAKKKPALLDPLTEFRNFDPLKQNLN